MNKPVAQATNHWEKTRIHVRKRPLIAFGGIAVFAIALFGAVSYRLILSETLDIRLIVDALLLIGLVIGMGVVISHLIAEQFKRQHAEFLNQTHRDALTGLADRKQLQQRLAELIEVHKATRSPFALLLMDLDQFKEINNTLGHRAGDKLLQQVAARIAAAIPHADVMARLGGDEFAILLSESDGHSALASAWRLQAALENPVTLNDMEIDIRFSVGIALFPDHGENGELLFRHAEVAMYNAKQHRIALTTYTSDLDALNMRRIALLKELRYALDNRQLLLHYQPKIDLTSNRTVGVEALLRWHHPQHGLIPPDEFITIAEQSDMIRNLTYWVIDEAILQCHAWRRLGYTLNVAINLSARNLHDPGLPVKVAGLLAKWAVPASSITLEITENAIMVDPERALKILMRLYDLGVHLSIDDFGTGYSSLIYLKKLPVTQIKVDRSFVINMIHDDDDAIIVQSTIDLGHNMNCQVVAEGVEDKETLERLRSLGCDHIQGYFLSRPLPAADITTWFTQSNWGVSSTRQAFHYKIA